MFANEFLIFIKTLSGDLYSEILCLKIISLLMEKILGYDKFFKKRYNGSKYYKILMIRKWKKRMTYLKITLLNCHRIFIKWEKLLFVLLIIAFTSIQFSFANVKYVHEKDKRQCSFIDNNQKTLLAGVEEKTYFFFPCNKIISTYDVKFSQGTYLISELLLSATPQTDQRYIRTIKNINNKFYDDKKLSYLLSTCVPLTKNSNQNLVKYLVNKKMSWKEYAILMMALYQLIKRFFIW